MKKTAILLTVLLLTISLVCGALADGVAFTTKYFTLELPEGWTIDTEDLDQEAEENVEPLGYFYSPDETALAAGCFLVYYEELKDMALWNAGEEELKQYAEGIMEEFEDDHPEYIGTMTAGSVPFVLIKCKDDEGEYLYADTITNGYSIQFEVSLMDEENSYPLTDEAIEQFKTILSTFKPAA